MNDYKPSPLKSGVWKLFYKTRNANSGLTIELNRLEDNVDGLVLFSYRIGIEKDNGKGGQFIPVRVKGKAGSRDINSWATEIAALVMEAEEQVMLFFDGKDKENGRTSPEEISEDNNG